MRELVDIILFTLDPPPPTSILIQNSLRCSKKRESLQHRISHRPTYLLRIYIMRIGKEKAALESKKTEERTEHQDSMMSDAMRAEYFCVGNNDQKS